jgi:hypothetical protein
MARFISDVSFGFGSFVVLLAVPLLTCGFAFNPIGLSCGHFEECPACGHDNLLEGPIIRRSASQLNPTSHRELIADAQTRGAGLIGRDAVADVQVLALLCLLLLPSSNALLW